MKMNSQKKCTKCNISKDASDFIKKCGMCTPCRSIHRRIYREKNLERFKEKDRIYHEKHKNTRNTKAAEYYQENKDKIQQQRKQQRQTNKNSILEMNKQKYYNDWNHRLELICRQRIYKVSGSSKNYKDLLGCSIDHLKRWFEFNLQIDNFTWEDYNNEWEIDHVVPCSQFDITDDNQKYQCFNWRNMKPESKSFNKKKWTKRIQNQILESQLRIYLFERL